MNRATDRDADIRARIQEHWEASERGDVDAEHAIYAADAILVFLQSGERFTGRSTIQAQRGGHPAERHFTIRRILDSGDLWVSECVITYDDVPTSRSASWRSPRRRRGSPPGSTSGRGVRHREHDRTLGHPSDRLRRDGGRLRDADEDVRALQHLLDRAALPVRVRQLRVLAHGRRSGSLPAPVDARLAVAADDPPDSCGEQYPGDREARRTDAEHDDLDVLRPFADDAQRVQERGQDDDGRAVLVVVEDGDVEPSPAVAARSRSTAARRCPRG